MARALRLTIALTISLILPAAGTLRAAPAAPPGERTRLVPHFTAGDTLRYQIDLRTSTVTQATGPIVNPEGASQLERSVNAVVRLEVIGVEPEATGGARVHLRTTYEKVSASSKSDAFDPQEDAIEKQYRQLEGRSIEFTIEADGGLSEIKGLKDVLADESTAGAVREWLMSLTAGAVLPKQGIAIGEKWSAEKPIEGAPLAGLAWRTESTYLRNEPCLAGAMTKQATAMEATPEKECAVILTKFEMVDRHGSGDPTPPEYLRNSLRTTGKWMGSGESLTSISLRAGMVVSLTQTGSEDLDFTVAAADTPSKIHYVGRVKTQSQITLLPPAAPQP